MFTRYFYVFLQKLKTRNSVLQVIYKVNPFFQGHFFFAPYTDILSSDSFYHYLLSFVLVDMYEVSMNRGRWQIDLQSHQTLAFLRQSLGVPAVVQWVKDLTAVSWVAEAWVLYLDLVPSWGQVVQISGNTTAEAWITL